MVSRQKKTREPADAAGTIAPGYQNDESRSEHANKEIIKGLEAIVSLLIIQTLLTANRDWMDAVTLLMRMTQAGILAGILYVLWWDVNHGIYPI